MDFWNTFGKVEDELHKVDPFYQTIKRVQPYLPDILKPVNTKYNENLRTMKNNRELQDTVNNPTEPEISQAQKINNFIENNKVMIGGSFALLIIFLMLR
jgi:hypothetical protein